MKSELVQRVKSVLGTKGALTARRFQLACAAALAAFACGAPQLGSSGRDAAPVHRIEIELSADGTMALLRPGEASDPAPLRLQFDGRQASVDVNEWLKRAVADFPMGGSPPVASEVVSAKIRSGTVLIRAEPGTPFRYVQKLMAQCGDIEVQIPDIRIESNGVVYSVPLPVDVVVNAIPPPAEPAEVCAEVRMDRQTKGLPGIRYSLTERVATPPGAVVLPEEVEEEAEDVRVDDFFVGRNAGPRRFSDLERVGEWIDDRPAVERVIQAQIDPRSGIRVDEVIALLDVLRQRDVTDVTFMGTYEQ